MGLALSLLTGLILLDNLTGIEQWKIDMAWFAVCVLGVTGILACHRLPSSGGDA